MSKLLLLYLTFIVGLVFLLIPDAVHTKDFFPFYDIQMYPKTYIYFILEKSILIILAVIIANEETQYKEALRIFVGLLCFDLIDYFLTYNTVWFHVGIFPVSMNTTKSLIFGLVIIRELWKRHIS